MTSALKLASGLTLGLLMASCEKPAANDQASNQIGNQDGVSASVVTDALQPAAPAAAPAAATRNFSGHLNAPSDLDVVMVYYDHVGLTPPIERWVDNDYQVTSADEFKRAEIRADKIAALKSQYQHAQGIGSIKLVSSSGLGEYSTQYSEFHIDALSPGKAFVFNQNGINVSLVLTNAADFYRLPMDRTRAQELTAKYGGRSVKLELDVAIESARPEGSGGTLEGRITKLRILGSDGVELAQ